MKREAGREATTPRRKRFWFDPRFAIGLALIAVSIAGVIGIVAAADSSVMVLAARTALSPGERVDASDLVPTSVRLDGGTGLYLGLSDLPDGGLIVTRPVAAGELLPASSVGLVAGTRLSSVVVTVGAQLSASVEPGSTVDLWASRENESGEFAPPIVVVSSATVVRLVERDGLVVDDSGGAVELLVPRERVARVLEAIANGDALSLVPTSIPVGR